MSAVDWDAVDWSQMDINIAADLGVTRERVRQVRRKRGLPPSNGSTRWRQERLKRLQVMPCEQLTTREIAERLNVARRTAWEYTKALGRKPRQEIRRPAEQRYLEAIKAYPGLTATELQKHVGQTYRTHVNERLRTMYLRGVVKRKGAGYRADPYTWWPA